MTGTVDRTEGLERTAEAGLSGARTGWLRDQRVAFVGRLSSMSRRQARQLVREAGGAILDRPDVSASLVVVGDDEGESGGFEAILHDSVLARAGAGELEVLTETQWLERLGLVEGAVGARRLYTPAMLADLLNVPIATIRRWHRRGLIRPVQQIHRLPYFDFSEVASARLLARLVSGGHSPAGLESRLARLAERFPEFSRPLSQLPLIVQGRQILLRQGEGLVDADGQMRIDFEALDAAPAREPAVGESAGVAWSGKEESGRASILGFPTAATAEHRDPQTAEEFVSLAIELEDEGRQAEAVEVYRSMLLALGAAAEPAFRLAELLYSQGDLTAARERYSMAVELDPAYVEARASLGCVLLELGDYTQAIAAFEGALAVHPDYPDVHYHLARTLDVVDRAELAERHWHSFLLLAPESPWAGAARQRLGFQILDGGPDGD